MDNNKKKELQEQYKNRHPEMGIVCWKCGDDMWVAPSLDTKADFNGTSFQLKLGSWPNREMQSAYKKNPDSFEWKVLKVLKYEDLSEDHTEDLQILMMEVTEEYPDVKPMKPTVKLR